MSAGPERRLADAFGYEHAALFGNARSGLAALLELVAADAAPVIFPSNVCSAVLAAVVASGAVPQLVPVSPLTGLADDERLADSLLSAGARTGVVMPTHLYGMHADYDVTRKLASERGWFIIENDSLGATRMRGSGREAFGNALLLSLGPGKTLDAGGGGAVLIDDPRLAATLEQRAAGWPVLDSVAESRERHLVLARRHLAALNRSHLAESLLDVDTGMCRLSLRPEIRNRIDAALEAGAAEASCRRERMECWHARLRRLAPELSAPDVPVQAPWRAVYRCQDPGLRDRIVAELRSAGVDAGTNYPPLADSFPRLLAGQAHDDATRWGDSVLTLWLTDDYDRARITRCAGIIEKAMTDYTRPRKVDFA
jgi:dTDP-4-amino-4,6-dideoxygalactose transaminase